MVTGERPEGQPNPFCEQENATSTPHCSTLHGHGRERGHTVHEEQSAGLVNSIGNPRQILVDTGRGLPVHNTDELGAVPVNGGQEFVLVYRLAPRRFDANGIRA